MDFWKKRLDQSVEQFSKYLGHIQRNLASAAAGLLLISLLGGVIAITWQAHRATLAKERAEQPSDDVGQLADLRRVNDDTLDHLADPTRMREERKDAVTSHVRLDLADVSKSLGSAMEGYGGTALENPGALLASYEVDNPRDRTYRRNFPQTYPQPGGVLYLTSVDPAALGPNAGDYLVLINKPLAALNAFRQRLAIDEQAVAADPGNLPVQTDLAYSSSRIGDLLADMGDQAGAVPYYQQAVEIYTKTAVAAPEDFATTLQLGRLLAKLAKTHTRLGYIEKAWAECNKAADLLESVAEDAATVDRRVKASAYSEVGEAYSLLARDTRTPQKFMRKLWASAREMYELSFTILINLRERGVLNADELTEVDTISQKIAECDLFLAK
jgi:tetratricopeptide (TPR) repeat protein